MLRWRVLRTLLYKEVLRYRYNWGLLAMILGLLLLSGLVSISAQANALPGQGGLEIVECVILHREGSMWAAHLRAHPPGDEYPVRFQVFTGGRAPSLRNLTMGIELIEPPYPANSRATWKAKYWYLTNAPTGILPYRDWFVRETQNYLGMRPRLEQQTIAAIKDIDRSDRVPMVMTALVVFSLYLISFNLLITSTGEEREKRIQLALLLTPARASELVAAKAFFYSAASLVVAMIVVGMYRPMLLAQPLLWSTVIMGSVCYVSIGIVVVSIVRRQTTISIISMLYLIITSIIMFLSQFLSAFALLKGLLMEDYLYRQLHQILSAQTAWWVGLNQTALGLATVCWMVVAVVVFAKRGGSAA